MFSELLAKANHIVNSADACWIGLIDESGYPTVSTISRIQSDGIFTSYFSTGTDGNKAKRIRACGRASICFRQEGSNVTLVGTAAVVTDPEMKRVLWQDWFLEHFPGGAEDPGYCILKFTAERASLWIDCEGAEFRIEDILKVQSRCGLTCNGCSYREPCNCGGCIETNGRPFHGECPVAVCCQEKGYDHCGECPDMPCEQLKLYTCDPEHGDHPEGARIELLKRWKKLSE